MLVSAQRVAYCDAAICTKSGEYRKWLDRALNAVNAGEHSPEPTNAIRGLKENAMNRSIALRMLGIAGAFVALALMLGVARAADDKIYVMKITLPTLNDPTYQFAKDYAAAVERHSGGRIKTELIRRAN